jgi:hypothetical protein
MEAWEPSAGFTIITKMLIKGWGAGNLYEYGASLGDANYMNKAIQYGNETKDNVTMSPSLLASEGWALAGGALMWGIVESSMQVYPNATWVDLYAPFLKTSVPIPGIGPGNSQNGWEAWYAFGHKAAFDISANIKHYLNFMNITSNLILRDGDMDGGIPTNIGDPDDTDESWVTSYWALFCLEPFNELGVGTPPSGPNITSTALTGLADENVTVTWNPSPEPDVILYEILYGQNYSPDGSGYVLLDAVYNSTTSYTHTKPNSTYYYMVTARDMEDWRTKSVNQGARFAIDLPSGWNLLGAPLALPSSDPSVVLQDVLYGSVWHYNSSDSLDHWKLYDALKPNSDLALIDSSMALWVDIEADGNLTLAGVIPQSSSVQLNAGWNLVSYPSFINRTVGDALMGLNYDRVECFDPSKPEYLRLMSDLEFMEPGKGYWIRLGSGGLWTLDNT